MRQDDENSMNEYGITSEIKKYYFYKQHRYERLSDALAFAEIDSARNANDEEKLINKA